MFQFHKRSFLRTVAASNKQPKLAFIPYFCYCTDSFNNNDNNKVRTILHTQISPRAGEKRSNRSISRLTGALGSAFMGATIMLSPMVANANDGALVKSASVTTTTTVNPNHETFKTFKGGHAHRKQVVRTGAARASNDRLSVVIYGIDNNNPKSFEFYSKTSEAISEAQKDGTEVVLVVGTSNPAQFDVGWYQDHENPMHLEIYANGFLVNDEAPILPYLNTNQGLIENPDFASDASKLFGVAKDDLAATVKVDRERERKQAALLSGPTTGSFPN